MSGEVPCESAVCECESLRKQNANLCVALEGSRRIGAAIGIVMSRRNVTYDQGFELLRHASQRLHMKLRDVAEEVLYIGRVPDFPGHEEIKATLGGSPSAS